MTLGEEYSLEILILYEHPTFIFFVKIVGIVQTCFDILRSKLPHSLKVHSLR